MEKILVFKTASENVVHQLLKEIDSGNTKIDCLIQNSLIQRYAMEYPNINFINIQQEGFYSIPNEVIKLVNTVRYDKLYIPLTGVSGHNFGNVMELVSNLSFKRAFFYNCDRDMTEIPVYSRFQDWLCRCYIRFVGGNYGRKEE